MAISNVLHLCERMQAAESAYYEAVCARDELPTWQPIAVFRAMSAKVERRRKAWLRAQASYRAALTPLPKSWQTQTQDER